MSKEKVYRVQIGPVQAMEWKSLALRNTHPAQKASADHLAKAFGVPVELHTVEGEVIYRAEPNNEEN